MMADVSERFATTEAMRQRITERIGRGRMILSGTLTADPPNHEAREQAARDAMADPETWYRLRGLFPSPATLEGWGKR